MKLGYLSEHGAIGLSVAAAAAMPFLSMKGRLVAIPLWMVASRLVSRGGRNHAFPPRTTGSEKVKTGSQSVMGPELSIKERPMAIVTGTNSGIGFYTAVGLAVEGYVVIITCRSAVLTQQTADRVRNEAERQRRANPKRYAHLSETVTVIGQVPLECDDFKSVRIFVQWVLSTYGDYNFQVLVNNAGGMRRGVIFSQFNPLLEFHTAVNFLGPMLLTELLLPLLEKNGGRVVYVGSAAHRFPQIVLERGMIGALWCELDKDNALGKVNGRLLTALKELNCGKENAHGPLTTRALRDDFVRYGTSKLLNSYHAHHIARKYANVTDKRKRVYACSLHPGCVATQFSRDLLAFDILKKAFEWASLLWLKTPEEGAQTTLHCAMCPIEELELVAPASNPTSTEASVSPYFAECAEKTNSLLLGYGWDAREAELIVAWGKELVALK